MEPQPAPRLRALLAPQAPPAASAARAGGAAQPFRVQSALVEVAQPEVVVEITRSLFQLARSYTESFSVYGDRQAVEWPQLEADGEQPILFTMGEPADGRGRPVTATRAAIPDRADLLPEPIRTY